MRRSPAFGSAAMSGSGCRRAPNRETGHDGECTGDPPKRDLTGCPRIDDRPDRPWISPDSDGRPCHDASRRRVPETWIAVKPRHMIGPPRRHATLVGERLHKHESPSSEPAPFSDTSLQRPDYGACQAHGTWRPRMRISLERLSFAGSPKGSTISSRCPRTVRLAGLIPRSCADSLYRRRW